MKDNLHRNGENFVSVAGEGLDFRAQVRVPEANCTILSSCEDVLGRAFRVSCDVDRAFVTVQEHMELSSDSSWTSRRSHGWWWSTCERRDRVTLDPLSNWRAALLGPKPPSTHLCDAQYLAPCPSTNSSRH